MDEDFDELVSLSKGEDAGAYAYTACNFALLLTSLSILTHMRIAFVLL